MSIEIQELQIIPKHKSIDLCEDKIVVTNDYACVIDGATTKSKLLFNNQTSGLKVSEILEEEIHKIPRDWSLVQVTEVLSNAINRYYVEKDLLQHMKNNPVDRLTASVAIYSLHYNQVWLIGDCQCFIDKAFTNMKDIDILLSKIRSFYIEKELLDGKTIEELEQNDTGRESILTFLKAQSYFQNADFESNYSYCAVDGFKINHSQIKIINVNESHSIVLASDGYPKLFENLSDSEEYLDYILKNDPLCFKLYQSTKGKYKNLNSYDDRAYLKFKIIN